jgi:ABC-type antimicrobial peptide transport system permease subunit
MRAAVLAAGFFLVSIFAMTKVIMMTTQGFPIEMSKGDINFPSLIGGLALLFGIINTMLMVVLERTKELGMLMAIGMNRFRVFRMIVLETVLLTLVGGVTGTLAGSAISKYFETHAIDMSLWAEGYSQLGYDTLVYASIDVSLMISVIIMVIITGIIAAIYPAYKALKHDPAEALRIE